MIVALMIGRKGSKGFPKKNTLKIFGKHLCEYPLIAAKKSKKISKIFISKPFIALPNHKSSARSRMYLFQRI